MAIKAAIKLGVDAVEIDVQQTADGKVIVFHDATLDRLCGAPGRVAETTAAAIRRLNPAVPTLAAVLRVCRGKVGVLIEIKGADPVKVAAVIRRAKMQRQVIVFAFDIERLRRFAAAAPRVIRFGLVGRDLPRTIRALDAAVPVAGLGVAKELVRSKKTVTALRRRGWPVFVWTVDDPATMRRLAAWNVDGIITNHPDRCFTPRRQDG
ncbi:glycerophosphodiester phosphodiesterase [bacterium]|nr:glycerophosphodiester phosphodiesterase [bacterium]